MLRLLLLLLALLLTLALALAILLLLLMLLPSIMLILLLLLMQMNVQVLTMMMSTTELRLVVWRLARADYRQSRSLLCLRRPYPPPSDPSAPLSFGVGHSQRQIRRASTR